MGFSCLYHPKINQKCREGGGCVGRGGNHQRRGLEEGEGGGGKERFSCNLCLNQGEFICSPPFLKKRDLYTAEKEHNHCCHLL